MDHTHLAELIATEHSYWWHVAKRELVVELLRRHFPPPARLLEAGLGGGTNLVTFQDLGYDVSGLDVLNDSVAHARARGLVDVQVHDIETRWPVAPRSVDVVVMLDVLEHLRDPGTALHHAADVLRAGGGVVFNVPAGPWLTSTWDHMLGHYRRYTRATLRSQAEAAGFHVRWMSYWNAFSVLPAVAIRLSERLFWRRPSTAFPHVPRIAASILLQCARAERALIRRMPIPCGLSLAGVLTR